MEMDERFTHIAKDPRFKKIPSRKRKVKIDSRFQQMFDDENFNTKYFVDKRGRKVKESANEDLSKFYELCDEDDEVSEGNKQEKIPINEETVNKKVASKKGKKKKKAKKEASTSDDKRKRRRKAVENEVEKEDELLNDLEVLAEENDVQLIDNVQTDVDNWQNFDANAPITDDSTRRLAICNMDWDKITADDLFVLLHSFVPSGGSINSVKIYTSDFGLERMEREDELGPTELVSVDQNSADSNDQEEEYSKEKLRQYQLNRLKYYYGVVECDTPETAEKIYEECDGMEYEASSSHLDLRFIPEDMTFDREPNSQATELPSVECYKPSEFITTALQQSTVRLTWDETDPRRVQTTMRNFSKDDILDMDFKAYLASSGNDESDREIEESENKQSQESKIAKYKELLEEINKKEEEDEGDNEMEITWEVGLKESAEEMVKRKKSEKEQKQLTPWENYLNERKQKKKMKQQLKQNKGESQSADELSDDELPADVDLNDPFFAEELEKRECNVRGKDKEERQKGKKKRKQKRDDDQESKEEKRRKAELQLLMMEDDDEKKHFNLKSIMKNEKSKKKTRKKGQEKEKDDFEIDVNDSRFSAVYSSHLYAVDPSDPQFKKTKAMESIIREKQRRSDNKNEKSIDDAVTDVGETISDKRRTADLGLSALIKTVKSNAGRFRAQKSKNGINKKQ